MPSHQVPTGKTFRGKTLRGKALRPPEMGVGKVLQPPKLDIDPTIFRKVSLDTSHTTEDTVDMESDEEGQSFGDDNQSFSITTLPEIDDDYLKDAFLD